MKRWIVLLVLVGACRSAAPPTTGQPLTGAAAPRLAVEQFMAAVRAADLQAMATAWGDEKGPARDNMERTELEKREIIMQGCFDHDTFRILDEVPGEAGRRIFRVELTKGPITATPRVTTTKGPSERWYVSDLEIAAVQRICRQG